MRRITRTWTRGKAALVVTALLAVAPWSPDARAADAGAKTLIDYFLPTPIICPLTSNTWGAASVLPRDVCNGLEDATNMQWQYWDGKILRGADGKYHIFAGRWPQDKGFADWPNSVIVEGVSNDTVVGSYIPTLNAPWTYDNGKEQNVTGTALNDGGFALIDSPGNIFGAASADGPWTHQGVVAITANGFTIATQTTENQAIWQSADNSFLIIARNFQEMTSPTNILGPYTIQATIPDLQSEGYEDPVVWCSGGQYHLVANMYNARKAYHFTSADGIRNWVNQGLAYDPTTNFVRYTDGTVNNWYKAERPGVFMENGHVIAFSFAVVDVDKTLDLANDNHGSKIIVVPFDGLTFDQENPGPGSAACPKDSTSPPDDAGTGGGDGGVTVNAGGMLDAGEAAADATASGGGGADAGGSGPGQEAGASGDVGAQGASAVDASGASAVDASGASGEGGMGPSPETDQGAASEAPASNAGCSCRADADHGSPSGLGTALFAGLLLAGRRRRAGA
jgi:MYXO-CTERM domain-containing protein